MSTESTAEEHSSPAPGPRRFLFQYPPLEHDAVASELPTVTPTTVEVAEAQAGGLILSIQRAVKSFMPVRNIFALEQHKYRLLRAIDEHQDGDRLVAMQASIDGIKESVDDLKNSMDRQFAQLTATIQAQARGANQLLSPVPNDSGTLPPQGLLPATWDSLERLNSDRTNRLLQFYALDVTGNLVSRRRRLAEYLRSTTQ